ncbi:hypothetical protein GCM10011341_39220 [Frigidibacter albus]|uniref:helicase-related protein n=1 Tax=Frigidibacter albus TaxID=1465486 RepID=UPI0019258F98|nr:helicase-related protein [Frigidibacter albus]GGH63800.1 hypothetical protein GCM10011341_39220 [Frigidibacter albus]
MIVSRLHEDLIGPLDGPEEAFTDRPTDRYLTGMLFPPRTSITQIEDEEAEAAGIDNEASTQDIATPFSSALRPSSAGISFAVEPLGGRPVAVDVFLSAGVYVLAGAVPEKGAGEGQVWHRAEVSFEDTVPIGEIAATGGVRRLDGGALGIAGMQLYIRAAKIAGGPVLVTLAVSNVQRSASGSDPDEQVFFQVQMIARPAPGTRFCEKPVSRPETDDEDLAAGALIYREVRDHVVGHTCSARVVEEGGQVTELATDWLPVAIVRKPRETGDPIFEALTGVGADGPLDAKWLSEVPADQLLAGLQQLVTLYEKWIDARAEEGQVLSDPALRAQADLHVATCRAAAGRIRAGIALLGDDPQALEAFRLANRAMWLQDRWKKDRQGRRDGLIWRPFQLAFVLLTLCSASSGADPDRDVMDLLWFPTGGGKTEAYLLLTAHVIFLRRLRAAGGPEGAGVTVFMRYTLRLLTIQQFQRAAAVILACDLLRRSSNLAGAARLPAHFATDAQISIGLWVGAESVPNKLVEAIEALKRESLGDQPASNPRRLTRCPQCNGLLHWASNDAKTDLEVTCRSPGCTLAGAPLPVLTVDELIYDRLPALMIGTADKYAQLAREPKTGRLFGLGTNHAPPDLVIQDELHLISGPLGTISGLYEIAIDELCSHKGTRPKVIGSTATIRRAASQIRALYDRRAAQFPPLGLDQGNSGFAATDEADPGRLYVGVTTTGRSAKFALQAVMASLMQAAADTRIPAAQEDGYWTLVTYFNALRELGGALTLARDDVGRSIEQYARRRLQEPARALPPPVELTSRISASEINAILDRLDHPRGHADCVATVLASNMISVGVDVARLGVMVVNGQPKTIAEYIQATSRVGRAAVPGLVVAICNANKPRDRSRYESFHNWHRALYRDVEATGVTPFAERARERALHAAFVICARHLIPELRDSPSGALAVRGDLEAILDRILARARSVEQSPAETAGAEDELRTFLDLWVNRPDLTQYWDKWKNSLLTSAEEAQQQGRATGLLPRPTPNSLRSVEASTAFALRDYEM